MDELQQLDTELDVPQTAWAELQLARGLGRWDVLFDPSAHRLDVLDEVLTTCRLPDERADGVQVFPAEPGIAGDGSGLEQSLELQRLGPPLVVGEVAGDGSDQRAVLALRPQRRVDGPERAFGRVRRTGPHQCRRKLGADDEGGRLIGNVTASRFGHEDDVDVRDVVELASPALAHADHREPAEIYLGSNLRAGDHEGSLERGRGQVGQRGRGGWQLVDR